jgi:hypothetical protein
VLMNEGQYSQYQKRCDTGTHARTPNNESTSFLRSNIVILL